MDTLPELQSTTRRQTQQFSDKFVNLIINDAVLEIKSSPSTRPSMTEETIAPIQPSPMEKHATASKKNSNGQTKPKRSRACIVA